MLSQAERSSYHIVFDHLAICNEISDEASALLSATVSQDEFGRRLRILTSRFTSLLATVDKLKDQISQDIAGSPHDVLLLAGPNHSRKT
jgi:hypothetical protein